MQGTSYYKMIDATTMFGRSGDNGGELLNSCCVVVSYGACQSCSILLLLCVRLQSFPENSYSELSCRPRAQHSYCSDLGPNIFISFKRINSLSIVKNIVQCLYVIRNPHPLNPFILKLSLLVVVKSHQSSSASTINHCWSFGSGSVWGRL